MRQCKPLLRRLSAVVLAVLFAEPAAAFADSGERVLVAVAANFAEVVEALSPVFTRDYGHEVAVATGSTGKLYAQIRNGAPFHVLLAADTERPRRLVAEGAAAAGSRFTYAIGRLTLWAPDPGRIGKDGRGALRDPSVRHIAIANPALAPYGAAARETLDRLGLWEAAKGKIVMGQNAGQTFALVASGNAEIGLVALSAVLSPRNAAKGSRWDVPPQLYRPIRQDAVLLSSGGNDGAAAFLRFLRSPEAREVIERYGYGIE